MTPPQTPKPLTEKELEDMGYSLSRMDTYAKIHDVAWKAVKELKRLCAGQARETSSKSEVKILMDELVIIRDCDRVDTGTRNSAMMAIEAADAVKDGPSEEDMETLKTLISQHLERHPLTDELFDGCSECWSYIKLKQYMGI